MLPIYISVKFCRYNTSSYRPICIHRSTSNGLAYISNDAFFSFTPMFFWKTLIPWVTTRENNFKLWKQDTRVLKIIYHGITCWMLSHGDSATVFKRKSCSKRLQKFYEFHYQGQKSSACLFNLFFFIIRNKLTNFIWTELSGHFSHGNKS